MTDDEQKVRSFDKTKKAFLIVWTIVGAGVITWACVNLINVLSIPVGIVLWTVVIVFCLRGTVNALEARGVSRVAGTAIGYVLMVAVIALIAFLMFSPVLGVGDQFNNLIQSIPSYVDQLINWANGFYAQYEDIFQNETARKYINDALSALGNAASDLAKQSASGVVAFGTGLMNTFVAVGFALIVAFWILIDLPGIGRETMRLAGPKRRETMEMLHVTFTRVMGGYIKGTVLQCTIIGVGCGILFTVLGVPNNAALGGITGILNIIPIVGPWLGGALAAIAAVFVSPVVALVAFIGTIAIQQIVYTFISPRIMASSVDIHPALNLIALMAGSAIGTAMSGLTGALVGMLASIPAVAVAKAIFVYYFEKRTGRQLVSADGVFFKGTPRADGEVDPVADAAAPHPDAVAAAEAAEEGKKDLKSLIAKRGKKS